MSHAPNNTDAPSVELSPDLTGQPRALAPAVGSAVWAMISNHPYYPSIDFFATEEEARTAAANEIKDMHAPDGHHNESSVSVARIVAHAQIKTHY